MRAKAFLARAARTAFVTGAALSALSLPVAAATVAEMTERTADIATRYLQVWSTNDDAAVDGVPYVYGPTVAFYGRTYSQAQLIDEKRRAIRQWPIRRYVHRPGSMQILCNAAQQRCGARSVIDFRAENPARGTSKRGSARFELGISFAGPKPRILYESGSLNRRRQAGGPGMSNGA